MSGKDITKRLGPFFFIMFLVFGIINYFASADVILVAGGIVIFVVFVVTSVCLIPCKKNKWYRTYAEIKGLLILIAVIPYVVYFLPTCVVINRLS